MTPKATTKSAVKAAPETAVPAAAATPPKPAAPIAKDLLLRQRFFPDAEQVIFDASTKGYGPLPIMLRKLLRHMKAIELRVLMYLYMRSGKYRICYPTVDEIAEEIGVH